MSNENNHERRFNFKKWAENMEKRREDRRLKVDPKAPVISVKNLKVYFKHGVGRNKLIVKAIDDVSFDIRKGEVFGLVGESGCGKTTTGRTIIKLHKPTDGEIFFLGHRISGGTIGLKQEIKEDRRETRAKIKELKAALKEQAASGNDVSKLEEETKHKIQALIHERNKRNQERRHDIKRRLRLIEGNTELMKKMQMIFQDPIESLNPRMTVKEIIAEGLRIHGFKDLKEEDKIFKEEVKSQIALLKADNTKSDAEKETLLEELHTKLKQSPINLLIEDLKEHSKKKKLFYTKKDAIEHYIIKKVNDVLETVGMLPEHASRYPHEFSGGQRQRIGVARAIINAPEFIIADEPISALDVSIQAQVINLLNDLRDNFGITILFIAHDLSVIKYFSDRIAVMYYGNLVELADADELFLNPLHPYTRSLLSAVPLPDPRYEKSRKRIRYNPATTHDYRVDKPKLHEIKKGHFILANEKELKEYKKGLK